MVKNPFIRNADEVVIPGLEWCHGQSIHRDYFGHIKAIIYDLDMTLVNTRSLEQLRNQRKWDEVYKNIPSTHLMYYRDEDCDCVNCDPVCVGCDIPLDTGAGIITSAPRKYAELVCKYHHIKIPILTAYHDTKKHKPDPEPIYHACEKLNLDPSQVAYVGDSVNDMYSILEAGGTGIHFTPKVKDLRYDTYDEFKKDRDTLYLHKGYIEMSDGSKEKSSYYYSKYYQIKSLDDISNSSYDAENQFSFSIDTTNQKEIDSFLDNSDEFIKQHDTSFKKNKS